MTDLDTGDIADHYAARIDELESELTAVQARLAEAVNDYATEKRGRLFAESLLAEAVGLLDRAYKFGIGHPHIRADVGTFLLSTPTPPPAPEALPEGFHARVANQIRAQQGKVTVGATLIERIEYVLRGHLPLSQEGRANGLDVIADLLLHRDAEPTLLERIEAVCNTVNGTYKHPDQLEEAVAQAFDRIRGICRSARGAR